MQQRITACTVLLAALVGLGLAPARPAAAGGPGLSWTVDRPGDDGADGDAAAHEGSLRFVLAHAGPGDIVRIGDIGPADAIFVSSTLVVGPGVSVGYTRDEACGEANRPLVNIEALPGMAGPIMRLDEGATLRNVTLSNAGISGPKVALYLAGADADVCAVAFGQAYDAEGSLVEVGAPAVALGVDGPRAVLHRSIVKGEIVVGVTGDDTRIGDVIGGSGEANTGLAGAVVTILAESADAAQRVTVRDPFPRGLSGLVGRGVAGGDDQPAHANNWALTPSIADAATADGFATVTVSGSASPSSLVDIYYESAGALTRQSPVLADVTGSFHFSGTLPGPHVAVRAGSTLYDPAHPGRLGSSSALSAAATVQPAIPEPLLAADGSVVNLSRPGSTEAVPGDRIQLQVKLTNVGRGGITHLASVGLQLSSAVQVIPGSGAATGGGSGFSVTDTGFSGGSLRAGESATYTLDATVIRSQLGTVVFSTEVHGDGIVAIPVVGRMRLTSGTGSGPTRPWRVWFPLVQRGL